jgi:hypothetical protein
MWLDCWKVADFHLFQGTEEDVDCLYSQQVATVWVSTDAAGQLLQYAHL